LSFFSERQTDGFADGVGQKGDFGGVALNVPHLGKEKEVLGVLGFEGRGAREGAVKSVS
jgi:hypothetical protein